MPGTLEAMPFIRASLSCNASRARRRSVTSLRNTTRYSDVPKRRKLSETSAGSQLPSARRHRVSKLSGPSSLLRARRQRFNQRSMSRPGSKSASGRSTSWPSAWPRHLFGGAVGVAYAAVPVDPEGCPGCCCRWRTGSGAAPPRPPGAAPGRGGRRTAGLPAHAAGAAGGTPQPARRPAAGRGGSTGSARTRRLAEARILGCNQRSCNWSRDLRGSERNAWSTTIASSGQSRRVATRSSCG